MSAKPMRSAIYGRLADRLAKTCCHAIDSHGRSRLDPAHGAPSLGHIAYGVGELFRCRPDGDLTRTYEVNLIAVLRHMIAEQLDLENEVHRCFLAMGLGLMGRDDQAHPVLQEIPESRKKIISDGLVVTNAFDNNWEAFNGSIMVGRHLLYGESAANMLPYFEKIAAKYDKTGYFDDTRDLGNYNNYGIMSINYALRAGEYLGTENPARRALEKRFKEHAQRYLTLISQLVSSAGDTWPFGRSAGVLGQLQCIALIEQCLAKNWVEPENANLLRGIARKAIARMQDLYWDEARQWFNFRDDFQTAYDYRASLPMAWDMLRYFLQIEAYAASDEKYGIAAPDVLSHQEAPSHHEIVTNPSLKTAIYVWSDGNDHAVLPIMAGPHRITGDSLPRPYAPGIFEWTTQHPVPVLCPRLSIGGEHYWPAWRAAGTKLSSDGRTKRYTVWFAPLYSSKGKPCPYPVFCETQYVFSKEEFERIDRWQVKNPIEIDEYLMEILQPAQHPERPRFHKVPELSVNWESEIDGLKLMGKADVRHDSKYRNYHGHASHSWKIKGNRLCLQKGSYMTRLRLLIRQPNTR